MAATGEGLRSWATPEARSATEACGEDKGEPAGPPQPGAARRRPHSPQPKRLRPERAPALSAAPGSASNLQKPSAWPQHQVADQE